MTCPRDNYELIPHWNLHGKLIGHYCWKCGYYEEIDFPRRTTKEQKAFEQQLFQEERERVVKLGLVEEGEFHSKVMQIKRKSRKRSIIGAIIKHAIDKRGIDRSDLARRLGVVAKTIEFYECGKIIPRLSRARQLERELNISITLLVESVKRKKRTVYFKEAA